METVTSVITFEGYTVKRLSFTPKKPASATEDDTCVGFSPVFERKIKWNKDGDCRVSLTATVGQPDDNMPFIATASIVGQFKVPDAEKANELMEVNGTAILYPYLRAVMTQLTSAANVPPVYLPIINLVEMLKVKDKVKIDSTESND